MPPLWILHPKHKKNNKGKIIQAPSLNRNINSSGPPQGPYFPLRSFLSAKEASPRTLFHRNLRASMTIEAALVLPLFLLFFLTLGSSLEMLRFHARTQMALWEIGRETCVYGVAVKGMDWLTADGEREGKSSGGAGAFPEAVGNLILSHTYVKGRVEDYLGKEYLEEAPIENGAGGLLYYGGNLLNEEDLVEFMVTYRIRPKWTVKGFRTFFMRNRYLGRMWTGYAAEETENAIYYLAEYAEVYHADAYCSHLKLSPGLVPSSALDTEVNAKGSHYRACAFCAKGKLPTDVWVSPEGECYHFRRDCSGLKRTVRTVNWREAEKYRPCSRCGSKKGEE